MADHFPKRSTGLGEVVLQLRGIRSGHRVRGVSLELRKGEILGLAGLVGAGRTELGETVAGLRKRDGGAIELNGKDIRIKRPADAVAAGIAYLSEDRKGRGLHLPMSTTQNIVMATLARYSRVMLSAKGQRCASKSYVESLRIKVADLDAPVLRVIEELHHIEVAVVGLYKVRLGASPHFLDMPASGERHREMK